MIEDSEAGYQFNCCEADPGVIEIHGVPADSPNRILKLLLDL